MNLHRQTVLALFGLILFGSVLAGAVHAASGRPEPGIVYSARYYKPGKQRSHYKIWRIDLAGARRVRVTSGRADDHSPIWMADGKTILFVRQRAQVRTLCIVNKRGGRVRKLATVPTGYVFIESVAPNRRSVVCLVHGSGWKLILFDIGTHQQRDLGAGFRSAWSPDSRRLYVSIWDRSEQSARILDLATEEYIQLSGDLRSAAWLDGDTLTAEEFAQDPDQARLVTMRADGTKKNEILLPFTWHDDLSPFADNIFAVPGDPGSVLYGRHSGNSTEGPAQKFYRVSVEGGQPTVVANGRDLAWSPDRQFFLTGASRGLAPLDRKRGVWVSPLSIVSLNTGETRTLVQGLVDVAEFDWRPSAANDQGHDGLISLSFANDGKRLVSVASVSNAGALGTFIKSLNSPDVECSR